MWLWSALAAAGWCLVWCPIVDAATTRANGRGRRRSLSAGPWGAIREGGPRRGRPPASAPVFRAVRTCNGVARPTTATVQPQVKTPARAPGPARARSPSSFDETTRCMLHDSGTDRGMHGFSRPQAASCLDMRLRFAGRFRGTTKGMHARGEVSERTPMRVRPDARSMSSPSAHTAMRARSRARTQSRRAPHWPSQSGTLMAEDDRSLAACAFPPDTALNTRLWTGPRPAPIHGNRQIYSSARVGRSLVALHRSFTHQVYPALITTCPHVL